MRRLLLLVGLACLGLAAMGTATAAARPAYGIQGLDTGADGTTRNFDVAKRLKTRITRLEASWASLEPDGPGAPPNPEGLAELDSSVNAAARRRLKVVLFVNRTPCWASSAPADIRRGCDDADRNRTDVTRWSPVRPADAVPIFRFLAARYGSKLAALQVWNEPDQANEKYWAGPDKVRKYVELMKAVYRPIKQANPKLPVLAGSFVGTDGRWLEAMYREGAKGFYDGLAVQFYSLPLQALALTRRVQRSFGDKTPLWLTEFGWSSCYRRGGPAQEFGHPCVTRRTQAQNLVDVLRGLRKVSWVKAAIQFETVDQAGSFKFGLLTVAGRRKPAYRAAARLQRGARLKTTRPTVRLRRSGRRVLSYGRASGVDTVRVRVSKRGTLRFIATLRTDRFRRWRIRLPAQLGTRGLTVSVRHGRLPGSASARI